jgi:hypothetical protein
LISPLFKTIMPTPLLTLSRGDSLNAWALSAVRKTYFPGEPAPARDPQNYQYINGFVDVGDLPCRVATWRDVATRTVQLETDWPVESLYLPGKSRSVEFSQFQHRPTRLSRWCRTQVSVAEDRYCSFRLTTRGGAHIWVDGELAARFEPFTRNAAQSTIVHLPLRAGGSEIVVLTEDMAERDVVWFFELTLIDATTVEVHLAGADTGKAVQALSALAGQVRPGAEVHGGDDAVYLIFDDPSSLSVTIHARVESTSHTHAVLLDRVVTLPEGASSVRLCTANELPDGFHGLWLEFSAEGSRVERDIGVPIMHQAEPLALGAHLASRKRLALDHAAIHGEMRMGTAVALLETDRADDERFRPIIEDTLLAIEERRDCADFVSVPLLWGLMRHGTRFPADLRARSEEALLNFRYWVDEPGNDVMTSCGSGARTTRSASTFPSSWPECSGPKPASRSPAAPALSRRPWQVTALAFGWMPWKKTVWPSGIRPPTIRWISSGSSPWLNWHPPTSPAGRVVCAIASSPWLPCMRLKACRRVPWAAPMTRNCAPARSPSSRPSPPSPSAVVG